MTGLGSSCGACKFLRRKCTNGCLFAPYFCYDQGATHFAAVHKIFGASNVSKLLSHLPVHNRSEAAMTISYEAQARVRDPIYGCVAHIYALQQQVVNLQEEIEFLSTQVSGITGNAVSHRNPQAMNNLNDFQPSSQQVGTHLCNSVDQHTPYISHAMDGIGNDQINLQLPPLYRESIGRWDHSLMSDFANEPIFLENHVLSATDQEILPNDPWLEGVVYEEY